MTSNERYIWNYLKSKGLSDYGCAGLLGNLWAESGLNSCNLENIYNKSLGLSDEEYTAMVDSGEYMDFVHDKAGYGIAQWTFWSRKQALLDFAKASGTSIGDLHMQLDFLCKELNDGYHGVLEALKNAASVLEASNEVLFKFECPSNQGESVQRERAKYGQVYFDKYASLKKGDGVTMSNSPLVDFTLISPNRTSPRHDEIDTVTIHCVVGQCTVESLGALFANESRAASSNYGVDKDGRIGMYVEEKDRAWCSGGCDKNGNPIRVNGISGADNDHRAITIEVASDTTHPYAVTDAAYEGLIRLLVDICKRNPGIKRLRWRGDKSLVGQTDKQNMTVHRWFAYKACPGDYLYERHSAIAEEVNRRLDAEILKTEDDDMDTAKFKELWLEMRKELQDNDAGEWSEAARAWAISNGLIKGNGSTVDGEPNCMWEDILTREQFITVLYRFAQMMGKI